MMQLFATCLDEHPVYDVPDDAHARRLFVLCKGSVVFVVEEHVRSYGSAWRRIVAHEGVGWIRLPVQESREWPAREWEDMAYYMVQL
jgi:hypothetical protein